MKLTCLNAGGNYDFPACHLLQMCGVRILLECPLDLSSLQVFLPVHSPSCRSVPSDSCASAPCSSHEQSQARKKRKIGGRGVSDDIFQAKRQREIEGTVENSLFKLCGDSVLIDAEPWYKTADLHLWDSSLIDVVLISNPAGMLALPFLTRNKSFSAKIYATEATAKIGQLLMEELIAMHLEYVQFYGPSDSMLPSWLDCTKLDAAPTKLREIVFGKDGSEVGNWHRLYSAADVKECMAKLHLLRYGEEACYNDTLMMKPISSGLEIGSSNWTIMGPTRSFTYLTGSIFDRGHVMGLDIPVLQGNDLILFSDFSALSGMNQPPKAKDVCSRHEKHNPNDATNSGVSKFRYKFPVYRQLKSSNGLLSAQGLQSSSICSSACSGTSMVEMDDSSRLEANEVLASLSMSSSGRKTVGVEAAKISSSACITTMEREKFVLICESIVKAIEAGGSVLIPMGRTGITLQLLEEISAALKSMNLGQVPMFYISSTMEETLAFANTIPEWISKQRQEKLYAGEALFGHIELMKEKRLYPCCALHSTQLVDAWKEPCVVFAPHWSLRYGPVAHLLYQWHQNPSCLLLVVEHVMDIELALSPFKPMAMKLLQCPLSSGLRLDEIAPVVRKLQPKLVLFPEALQKELPNMFLKEQSVLFYYKGQTLHIPSLKNEIEVDMATDLAFQLQPKQVGQGKITGAQLKAKLHIQDGRFYLESGAPMNLLMSSSNQQCQGMINPDVLLLALRERGICAVVEDNITSQFLSEGEKESNSNTANFVVNVISPSKAIIEVNGKHTLIKADDTMIRCHIFEAVNSVLCVI